MQFMEWIHAESGSEQRNQHSSTGGKRLKVQKNELFLIVMAKLVDDAADFLKKDDGKCNGAIQAVFMLRNYRNLLN